MFPLSQCNHTFTAFLKRNTIPIIKIFMDKKMFGQKNLIQEVLKVCNRINNFFSFTFSKKRKNRSISDFRCAFSLLGILSTISAIFVRVMSRSLFLIETSTFYFAENSAFKHGIKAYKVGYQVAVGFASSGDQAQTCTCCPCCILTRFVIWS